MNNTSDICIHFFKTINMLNSHTLYIGSDIKDKSWYVRDNTEVDIIDPKELNPEKLQHFIRIAKQMNWVEIIPFKVEENYAVTGLYMK